MNVFQFESYEVSTYITPLVLSASETVITRLIADVPYEIINRLSGALELLFMS